MTQQFPRSFAEIRFPKIRLILQNIPPTVTAGDSVQDSTVTDDCIETVTDEAS